MVEFCVRLAFGPFGYRWGIFSSEADPEARQVIACGESLDLPGALAAMEANLERAFRIRDFTLIPRKGSAASPATKEVGEA